MSEVWRLRIQWPYQIEITLFDLFNNPQMTKDIHPRQISRRLLWTSRNTAEWTAFRAVSGCCERCSCRDVRQAGCFSFLKHVKNVACQCAANMINLTLWWINQWGLDTIECMLNVWKWWICMTCKYNSIYLSTTKKLSLHSLTATEPHHCPWAYRLQFNGPIRNHDLSRALGTSVQVKMARSENDGTIQ